MVCARACFHADEGGPQVGDELPEFDLRPFLEVHGKDRDVLCMVDSNGYDCHDFPISSESMNKLSCILAIAFKLEERPNEHQLTSIRRNG